MPTSPSITGTSTGGSSTWSTSSSGWIPTNCRPRSIQVVDQRERLLGSGRFTTDRASYAAMRKYVDAWPDRIWAVEGSNGAGRPLDQRLLEDGEQVVDVPAKLAARVRLFDTGHNRKTDAHDAHAVAAVAVRTTTLRVLPGKAAAS